MNILARKFSSFPIVLAAFIGGDAGSAIAQAMSWEDCVLVARERHPSLVAAARNIEAAQAGVRTSAAAFLPQLSANGSAQHSDQSGAVTAQDDISFSTTISLEQSLYTGGRNSADLRAARAGLDAAMLDAQRTDTDTTCALRSAFVELLYAQSQLDLVKRIHERRSENLELVQLRYQGGREHQGSMALSNAAFHEAETDVTQALRRVAIARIVLTRAIGLEDEPGTLSVTGALGRVELPAPTKLAALVDDSPEFKKQQAAELAAAARVDTARGAFLPSVSLAGSAGRSGNEDAFGDDRWSVGLRFSLPLWLGGRTAQNFREAMANLQRTKALTRKTRLDLASTFTETLTALQEAVENASVQEQYLQASELRAGISRKQYENGLLAFENWDIIENDLISNRKRMLDAQRRTMLAEAAWWKTSGKGLLR